MGALAASCTRLPTVPTAGDSGTGGTAGTGGAAGGANPSRCHNGPCADFPTTPVGPDGTPASVPPNAKATFGISGSLSGGPCLIEPQDGALFPNNWLRPRFRLVAPASQSAFEITISVANQMNPLVVYTNDQIWTMPKAMWQALAADSPDMPITVKVRGAADGGAPAAGTTTTFTIAPGSVSGSVIYWSPTGPTFAPSVVPIGTTTLSGFAVGDESVAQILVPGQVQLATEIGPGQLRPVQPPATSAVECIGCHTLTPDGATVAFNDFYPWGADLASGAIATLGRGPGFLGQGGYYAMIQSWMGMTTFSAAHWSNTAPTEHVMVAALGTTASDTDQRPGLAWFNLEAGYTRAVTDPQVPLPNVLQGSFASGAAWNWIYQPQAGAYAAAPFWSNDGTFISFTMTSNVMSGRLNTGTAHLYEIAFSTAAPQAPTAVPGDGSDPAFAQYYGALSNDDAYIVFDRIPAATAATTHPDLNGLDGGGNWGGMYMQPATELYVIPRAGGTATRLTANDPPTCPNSLAAPYLAPGEMNNGWAKWSPRPAAIGSKLYDWIVFSSWREGAVDSNGSPIAQLYLAAVVRQGSSVTTYPAIYLWNQPPGVSNFAPAWTSGDYNVEDRGASSGAAGGSGGSGGAGGVAGSGVAGASGTAGGFGNGGS
jgi:hypothetical protein